MTNKISFQEIVSTCYSVDDFDYGTMLESDRKGEKRICPLCHKEFYPSGRNWSRQKYCRRTHFIDCVMCGKPIPQLPPSEKYGSVKCACKGECSTKFRAQQTSNAIKEKYGVDNISQSAEFKKKISESLKKNSEERTKKMIATLTAKYGGVGTASPVLRSKIEATTKERYQRSLINVYK